VDTAECWDAAVERQARLALEAELAQLKAQRQQFPNTEG
jgi:hypothetical protein